MGFLGYLLMGGIVYTIGFLLILNDYTPSVRRVRSFVSHTQS